MTDAPARDLLDEARELADVLAGNGEQESARIAGLITRLCDAQAANAEQAFQAGRIHAAQLLGILPGSEIWRAATEQTTDDQEPASTRTEWGVRLTWDTGEVNDHPRDGRADAEQSVAMHRKAIADRHGWRVTSVELIRRQHTTTGWTVVNDQEAHR